MTPDQDDGATREIPVTPQQVARAILADAALTSQLISALWNHPVVRTAAVYSAVVETEEHAT